MKKEVKKKKIIGIISSSVVLVGAAVGAIFGLTKYSITPSAFERSSEIQDKYEIQVDVNWNSEKPDINNVAKIINNRLDFFNLTEGQVSVINDDSLFIEIPITSINSEDTEKFDSINEEELFNEIIVFNGVVSKKSNIELRTQEGQLLFDYSNGQVKFIEPTVNTPEETPTFSVTPPKKYDIKLFDDARVGYTNGIPFVEVLPAQDLYNEFIDMGTFLSSNWDATNNPTMNKPIIWFDYNEFEYLLDSGLYPDYSGNPLGFIYTDINGNPTSTPRSIADPYFIGEWLIDKPFSPHPGWIPIQANLSEAEASSLVESVKFANSNIDLSVSNSNLKLTNISSSSINWLHIGICLLLGLIALFMVWWFGLLGLIASLTSLTTTLALVGFISATAIPFTTGVFIAIAISNLLGAILSTIAIKIYKLNHSDTKTILNKYIDNNKTFIKNTFPLITIALIVLILSSLLLPISLQVFMYILTLGVVIGTLMTLLFTIPSMFAIDGIFNFTEIKNNKWDFIKGSQYINAGGDVTKTINKYANLKTSRLFVYATLLVSIITFTIFGINAAIRGNVVNVSPDYNGYYKYDVVYTTRWEEGDWSNLPSKWKPTYEDPFAQNAMITSINQDKGAVLKTLKKYGISAYDVSTIRNDNQYLWHQIDPNGNWDAIFDYSFAWGLSIYSENKIDSNEITTINKDLKSIGTLGGYELNESWSLIDPDNVSKIQPFTNTYDSNRSMLGILLAFGGALMFTLIFFKWHAVLAVGIITIFESFLAFGLTTILFAPFSPIFWTSLLIYLITSLVVKFSILTSVRNKIKLNKKPPDKEKIFNFYKEASIQNIFNVMYIYIFLIVVAVIPIIFIGTTGIISLLMTIFGGIILTFTTAFVFAPVVSAIHSWRLEIKKQIREEDEIYSKQKDVIDEEYIKGINK